MTGTNQDSLTQRREWFRFFPEGSVEFLLVTRVLALGFMLLLPIVQSIQAIAVTSALVFVLWADHLILIWWCIQLCTDLRHLKEPTPPPADRARHQRTATLLLASLPLWPVLLAAMPWDRLLFQFESQRLAAMRIVLPALALAFLAGLVPAYRRLRRAWLEPALWTFLLLVPVVHWFALRRILVQLQACIEPHPPHGSRRQEASRSGMGLSLTVADITWFLAVISWTGFVALSFEWGGMISAFMRTTCALAGSGTAVVMATAELAAIEHVQQQFVRLLRKPKADVIPAETESQA